MRSDRFKFEHIKHEHVFAKKATCALCNPDGYVKLCQPCFEAWPKGVNLEEYLAA